MTIQEIYDHYRIPERLQLHMLRVAAVAQFLCNNCTESVNSQAIVSACLLHDMGNIIKIPFESLETIAGWQQSSRSLDERREIKKEFVAHYGDDEHEATYRIASEVTTDPSILELVNVTGYSKIQKNIAANNLAPMICCYADMRVQPTGVVSVRERLEEAFERYKGVKYRATREEFEKSILLVQKLEHHVFASATLQPESITAESTALLVNSLRKREISYE